ncbi:MAG: tetratricopeptide repeat protein [Verrucomicrobia bacterium]|nr:tetratricopeptide repeat protein [Verrucomicrobiota bacterium]
MAVVNWDDAPRKARELYEKGNAAAERGNYDYAMDMYTTALELAPKVLRIRGALRSASVKKFLDKKGGELTHLISSIQGLATMIGASSQIKSKPEQALVKCEKLLRLDPANQSFINLFVQAAIAADMTEAAVQTLEIGREFYPKDTKLIETLAKLYAEIDETQKARQCYETLVQMKPKDQNYVKALKDATALDTMKSGGWKEAESYRDVMKDEKAATLLEQQSKAVKSDDDIRSLIAETKLKIEREPGNVNYKRALADLYVKSDLYAEAEQVLQEAFASTGGADPQIDRALSNVRIKQFDFEIDSLARAGNAAEAEARKQERDAFLLKDSADRVKRYPNDLQFKYEYGVLLFEHEQFNEAAQQFQFSQRNPQRRTQSLYYLGLCFERKGQHDIAIEQLEKAAAELHTMDNMKKDIVYELGQISETMGDMAKAADYYKQIYAVDIGYKDISKKIEQAYKKD